MKATRWVIAGLLALTLGVAAAAAPTPAAPAGDWQALSPTQKQILAPLERDWDTIDAPRRSKWLEVAARFPSMPPQERARLQARMADWARMSPTERSRARLQFQEARQVPAPERKAKWQAYQALPEPERKALALRAKPVAKPASGAPSSPPAQTEVAAQGKRNLVQPTAVPRSRPASPTAQQARPGATTTSMTTKASPPPHHQAGLPKIAATPGFVDPSTLLPQRGPQGAAVRSAAAASAPSSQP